MRPWPLLLLAASSDARCRCDRRVIVATTVNGVRTASLLVPSAARVGAALVVYHEDSADAAAGLEPTEPRARATRRRASWRRRAATRRTTSTCCTRGSPRSPTRRTRRRARDGLRPRVRDAVARPAAPRHATHLTAKAHFIFRKVAAIRHAAEAGARDASVDVVAWADADIELVAPLADARFLAFARAHDVATIHRYVVPSRADYPRDGDAAACLAPRRLLRGEPQPARAARHGLPDARAPRRRRRAGARVRARLERHYARRSRRGRAASTTSASTTASSSRRRGRRATASPAARGGGGARSSRRAGAGGRARRRPPRRRRRLQATRSRRPPPRRSCRQPRRAPPGGARAALDRSVAAFARAGRRAVVEGWYALCAEAGPPRARRPPAAGAAARPPARAAPPASGSRARRSPRATASTSAARTRAPARRRGRRRSTSSRARCTPRAARTSATGARRTAGAVSRPRAAWPPTRRGGGARSARRRSRTRSTRAA